MDNQGDGDSDQQGMVNPIQVEKYLSGLDYPATKQEIIDKARENGADENIIATLQKIEDRMYDGTMGVSEEIGKFE